MSKRTKFLLGIGVIAALVLGLQIASFATGSVGTASGFEDDDGNLTPASLLDWNSFAPDLNGQWTGTSPTRQVHGTSNGWHVTGIEDWQASTSDSAFAGGTKQDKECASLIAQKADNKADLKRVYIANKTLSNGHIILNLAWVRIPQNTTSPSAHVAFEFNQSDEPCVASQPNGVVKRTVDDLLVLYDFEGGNDVPVISISRWTGSTWSAPDPLTAGEAEAAVNTGSSVSDAIHPDAPPAQSLGIKEFGEAGIDLTQAGVFPATPTDCLSFGRTFGVTRTSGNSNTAQMKDIAGPADVNISNCGSVSITKTDDADPGNPLEGAEFTAFVDAAPLDGAAPGPEDTDVAGTCTTDAAGLCTISDLLGGQYWIVETVTPDGFETAAPQHVVISGNSALELTFVDNAAKGAIQVTKTAKHAGDGAPDLTATFSVKQGGTEVGTITTDGTTGIGCLGDLAQGSYTVEETSAADGYALDPSVETVNVNSAGTCASGAVNVGFENAPLTDLDVSVTSQVAGGTSSTIECDDPDTSGAGPAENPTLAIDDLEPGTYTCTVVVDP